MLRSILQARSPLRLVRLGYYCLLVALCWALLSPPASQAELQAPPVQNQNWSTKNASEEEILVVYRNQRGETACRAATKAERENIIGRRGGSTRLIYNGAPRETPEQELTSEPTTKLALQPSAGLRIVLHGTTQLNQNQAAKDAFIVAANRWEAIVATPITVVIDVDFGPTFFGQPYGDPDILGAAATSSTTGPFSDLRERLINRASNMSEQELYNALPTAAVPIELDGAVSNVANARVSFANARALGIVPDITNPDLLTLGQGDAGIGFNSAFPFDFNPDDGISQGLTDFDAVATHEIGHTLGFVSNSGRTNTSAVTVWDLFRFRTGVASLATFATVPRVMSIGGSQVFFNNQLSTFATFELSLSTGGPNPGPATGDGRQSSHWQDDTLLSTRPYIGIMDPTLNDGLRRTLGENDIKALDLFGYSIGGPPLVRPPNDNFANSITLTGGAGSTSGSNENGTREVGEPIHAGFLGDKSIWYSWQSPITGQATFDTIGSNFDTTLAIYTGSAVNQLTTIAQNDDITNGVNRASRVTFNVTAGTTYRIAVDGWNGEFGNVTLNWTSNGVVPTPTPTPSPTPTPTPTPVPTPTPPADLAVESFVATPDPVAATQYVSFALSAKNQGPGPALFPSAAMVLPAGVTFSSCLPDCFRPSTSDGGTVTANFGSIAPGQTLSLVVTAQVTAPSGTTLSSNVSVSSSNPDVAPANNSATTTVRVVELVPFSGVTKISLSTEGAHVLVLRGGTVWTWGHNFYGQLGDGTNVNRNFPAQVDDLMFVKDIGAGSGFSVALKNDGTVWTWGTNENGQLGIGTTVPTSSNRPVQVVGLSSVTAIAAGTSHIMALKSDGTVWTWGWNPGGELGIGSQDFIAHPTPVQVAGLSNIVRISAGSALSYAMKPDGTVWGWGLAFGGKLGDGTTGNVFTSPIELPHLKNTTVIGSGAASTVAMKQDGTIWSFGSNFLGRLGRGISDSATYPVPTQIAGLLAKTVSAGYSHTLVTEPGGTIKVFGGNEGGQLGLGNADLGPHPSPILVPEISGVFATAAGGSASLALLGDPVAGGTIRAWGGNSFGVLGIGSSFPTFKPAIVAENLTVARPIFGVPDGMLSSTQVHIACGTPGAVIHYTINGSDPTENDPVVASGSAVTVDHPLTLKAKAFRNGFTPSAVKSASYTVGPVLPIQLLLDQSGPALDQVAALDSLLFLRDAFPVLNMSNLLNTGSDHNTRVIVFATNLRLAPGEPASSVIVNLVDSNNQAFDVAAEDVRALANSDLVQVTFRLPNNLAVGTCILRIKFQARVSNAGTIRIRT